jgi:hypothetical protein
VPPKAEGIRRTEPRKETLPPSERQLDQKAGQPQRPPRTEVPEKARSRDQMDSRTSAAPAPAQSHIEKARPPQRKLPGEPASQLSPNRTGGKTPPSVERGSKTPQRTDQREAPPAGSRRTPATPNQTSKGQRPGDAALPPGSAQ